MSLPQGSVRRARQMLEAGRLRPRQPDAAMRWPLAAAAAAADDDDDDGDGDDQPPPRGSRLPSSPSVYSDVDYPTPLFAGRQQPQHQHQPPSPTDSADSGSDDIDPDLHARVSIATEELFRQSTSSSVSGLSLAQDHPPEPSRPDYGHPARPPDANSAAPPAGGMRRPPVLSRSLVSPIPEEQPSDSPTVFLGSYASSRAIPSSWGSGPAAAAAAADPESLGTYLEEDSDEADLSRQPAVQQASEPAFVRQASVGKMGRPSLRTIQRPNSGRPPPMPSASAAPYHTTDAIMLNTLPPMAAAATAAAAASAAPTTTAMSDIRPAAHRPPRLNLGAVREAEARGSLTSLPDLIRRATRLASNLERGRTASRLDLSSISDLLNSFPNPTGRTSPDRRPSWPVLFKRPAMQNLASTDELVANGNGNGNAGEKHYQQGDDGDGSQRRPRQCCGMPTWLFALLCATAVLVVAAAILVPIVLVVLPQQQANALKTFCEKTNPCRNGGASVSSGSVCGCVCANGFVGRQCTLAGDASCVVGVAASSAGTPTNATMGSALPHLFAVSHSLFGIALDSTTLLALFSQNNVSCATENALVSFSGHMRRRALPVPLSAPAQPLARRASATAATLDGILIDSTMPATATTAAATAAGTGAGAGTATATATATAAPTAMPVSPASGAAADKTTLFAQVAVLYILQQTGTLAAASQAQAIIQAFLAQAAAATATATTTTVNADFGPHAKFAVDFARFSITLWNGTIVGG